MVRSWREGEVASEMEQIVIVWGRPGEGQIAVARVAPSSPSETFAVQFLLSNKDKKSRAIVEAVHKELDFYLVEKEEDDPWAYAIYHCSTAGNLYGDIHWGYHPDGIAITKPGSILLASRLTVSDRWDGMCPAAPIVLHADLTRTFGKGLAGPVALRVGRKRSEQKDQIEAKISEKVSKNLLALLANIPAFPGKYEPFCSHTDDFPSIKITVETPDGPVEFFTESQGKDHIPWGLTINGQEFTVDSPVPAQILRRLDRYLGRKQLNEMVAKCWSPDDCGSDG